MEPLVSFFIYCFIKIIIMRRNNKGVKEIMQQDYRGKGYSNDDDDKNIQTILELDELLEQAYFNLSYVRFKQLLQQAVRQLYAKVQDYFEAEQHEQAKELIQVLQNWVYKYSGADEIAATLCLCNAVYYFEEDPQSSRRNLKKAKYFVEESPNQHFLAKIYLVEAELYFSIDEQRAFTYFNKCTKFCEKNALYYSQQKDQHVLQEMKEALMISYYKLAVLQRSRENQSQVIHYLKESLRYANDLYGPKNPIVKRIDERFKAESNRSRQMEMYYSNKKVEDNPKDVVYSGQIEYEDGQEQKVGELLIQFDRQKSEIQIQLKIAKKGGKREKLAVEFPVNAPLQKVMQLGKCIKWFTVKNSRIEIDQNELKRILQEKKVVKGKNLLKFIQKNQIFASTGTGIDSYTSEEEDFGRKSITNK